MILQASDTISWGRTGRYMSPPDAITRLMSAFREGDGEELVKVRTIGTPGSNAEEERADFPGLAGQMMQPRLVHHARPLYRKAPRVASEEEALPAETGKDELSHPAAIEPRLRTVEQWAGSRHP